MDSKYNFSASEKKLVKFWEQEKVYQWNRNLNRENNFAIDTPPPTVSGELHLGHVFSYVHTDFIARFQRMMGKNVFYPIGFDNNGLPTEKLMAQKLNISTKSLDQEDLHNTCLEFLATEHAKFKHLLTDIGLSIDWSLEYSTISPKVSAISQASFIDLFNKKDIYLAKKPVIWDVKYQTAIAKSEIEEKQRQSFMYNIELKILGSNKESVESKVQIATTRPELLPACVAIFFNPNDERYIHLHNKYAQIPVLDIIVPILADDAVKIDKGTGLVMCATFGDFTDVMWQKKHSLPIVNIISEAGTITAKDKALLRMSADGALKFQSLHGLSIQESRNQIITLFADFIASSISILQTVQCSERSGCAIEILPKEQWFIKAEKYKNELLHLSQMLNWFPNNMSAKLHDWINNLDSDWCISRNRSFGIPIPVWVSKKPGEEGKIIIPDYQSLPINPQKDIPKGYSKDEVSPEICVLDTWATSCISPYINAGSIFEGEYYNKIFPLDLRPQSHEIIRTWTFGTLLKTYLHTRSLPWKNIMISGWCVTKDKAKMSKSKGNATAPQEFLNLYGADAIRYWCSQAKLGSDIVVSEETMQEGKKFVTKIYNAGKFCLMQASSLPEHDKSYKAQELVTCTLDKWLFSSLNELIDLSSAYLQNYDYHSARCVIEEFFKKSFCDSYIELIKVRSYSSSDGKKSAQLALYLGFLTILKLFAPFFPYVTEELYSNFTNSANSIHQIGFWPKKFNIKNKEGILSVPNIITALSLVHSVKSKLSISLKAPLKILYILQNNVFNCPVDLLQDLQNATCAQYLRPLTQEEFNLLDNDNIEKAQKDEVLIALEL